MLTNPYFCPMPWTGLMYNFDGKIKNCIRSVETEPIGYLQDCDIETILHGDENLARQEKIINHSAVSSCQTCYDLERSKSAFDIISDRKFYIRELKSVSPNTYTLGNFDLHTVDVRWSNLCNFACVYCSSQFSSRWANELGKFHKTPTDEQQEKFKRYILDHAPNLKHVYLAGGEPLLMQENLELLEKLNPDVQLRINTNLSRTDTKIFQRICEFKNVHWTVSAETLYDEYEYIRYGGSWSDFITNLTMIKSLDHKITFNMLWFLLNYSSVFDFVEYMQNLGFHNNSFVIGALLSPPQLNIRHLPDTEINKLQENLKTRISNGPGYLLQDSYENMLAYIGTPAEKNFNDIFRYLETLDQRRGLDSRKIFDKLYKLQ